jgi:lipopolysaccharide export system permease protein
LFPVKLYRYIMLRFLLSFGVGTLVFTSLLLMDRSSRQVEQLAPQTSSLGQFFTSFILLAPPLLSYSIALAFLMAMISTLNEMKGDQELQAMFFTGASPLSVLFPYLVAAVGAFAVTLSTTVYLTPLSFKAYNDRVVRMARHQILNDLKPGAFFKGIPDAVLMVGDYDPKAGELGGLILVGGGSDEKTDLVLARSGTIKAPEAGESNIRLNLTSGTIHPLSASEPGYRIASFDQLTSLVESTDPGAAVKMKHLLMGSGMDELEKMHRDWQTAGKVTDAARVLIEKHRRFSIPATLLIYPFIIYPMSISSRKHGRAAAFSSSIFLFFISYFLFTFGTRLALGGRVPAEFGAWLHVLVLFMAALCVFVPFLFTQTFLHRAPPSVPGKG